MRVFMLGWEFPPFISGGLGTACYGLTKAMSGIGTDIMFVLPRPVATPFSTHVKLVSPREGSPLAAPITEYRLDEFDHVAFRTVNANLQPYQTGESYQQYRADVERRTDADEQETAAATTTTPAAAAGSAAAKTPRPGTGNYAGDLFSEVQRYAL